MSGREFTIPESFLAAVEAAQTLVLMTHRGPDGDGLGSELALARALTAAGKRVHIINEDPVPPRFRYLDPEGRCVVYRRQHGSVVRGADLGLLVDTSEVHRAGGAAVVRQTSGGALLAIDHHLPSDTGLPGFIAPESASTAEMVWALLRALDLPLTPSIATALYTGIVYDTAGFRYVRNEPRPFEISADLVANGADTERVQREIFSQPRSYVALLGRLLGDIIYIAEGRAAILALTHAHTEGLDLHPDDLSEVVNVLNAIRGVDACALIRQTAADDWRINLRCVEGIEIGAIARELGGGGHARASGATMRGVPLEEVIATLTARLEALFV